MATATQECRPSPAVASTAAPPSPIKAFAVWGGLCIAFIAYVWIKWLTGPYAQSVEIGPSHEPGWMSTVQTVWQVLAVPAMLVTFYVFLIRPWRRERRLATDGLLCIGFLLLWFQDPLTNYFQPWVTYNSNLVNAGSWVKAIPGWMSYGDPRHQLPEPVLFTPEVYVFLWLGISALGTAAMRRAKARMPHWGPYRLLAFCWLLLALVDLVAEGLIFMPLGFYTYGGGPAPILFPSHYYVFPLHEPIFTGLMFTAAAGLRYFKDDKGYTIVERGADRIASPCRRGALRALALIGAAQLCMLIPYTIPVAIINSHAHAWPADLQKRSYLTDFLCGAGTNRACPGSGVPIPRGNHSAHLGPRGRLVVPASAQLPRVIPFAETGR